MRQLYASLSIKLDFISIQIYLIVIACIKYIKLQTTKAYYCPYSFIHLLEIVFECIYLCLHVNSCSFKATLH